MFQEVIDFRDESEALHSLLVEINDADFDTVTQFKSWTLNDIIGHLRFWNHAAVLSLNDETALLELLGEAGKAMVSVGIRQFEDQWLDGLSGVRLREKWRDLYLEMTEYFGSADPKSRVKWAGPDMSVRSCITARLMETWAHGQAAYDALGVDRENTDRIKGVAVLGVNTFGWTFTNRGLEVPADLPYVRLTAPSGEIWEWNEPGDKTLIEGAAEEFCQVVTQTRNIADTKLRVEGEAARKWMEMAQCFAGPPEDPPHAGTRVSVTPPSQ